jgi:hypothetical protein
MVDSATPRKLTRPGASFACRYGFAFASVAGALLLDLVFHHFNLPHPFAAFALSAIAITFWYGGTKPGIVAVLLSSLIRGFIFEGETVGVSVPGQTARKIHGGGHLDIEFDLITK